MMSLRRLRRRPSSHRALPVISAYGQEQPDDWNHDAGGDRRGVRRPARVPENPRAPAASPASHRFRRLRQRAAQGRQRELRWRSGWGDKVPQARQPAQDRRPCHGGQQRSDPQGHDCRPRIPGADRRGRDLADRRRGRRAPGAAGRGRHPDPDRRPKRDRIDPRHPAQCRPGARQQSGDAEGCAACFETYTATLASKGDAIDSIMRKADNAFASIDSAMSRIDDFVPGLANGKADELFEKMKSLRELAESFNKKSAAVMEEGRRSLLDISQAAVKLTRKFDPQAASGEPAGPVEADLRVGLGVQQAGRDDVGVPGPVARGETARVDDRPDAGSGRVGGDGDLPVLEAARSRARSPARTWP